MDWYKGLAMDVCRTGALLCFGLLVLWCMEKVGDPQRELQPKGRGRMRAHYMNDYACEMRGLL
eukprot:8509162-Alexandrium_andersonii.AAC.1